MNVPAEGSAGADGSSSTGMLTVPQLAASVAHELNNIAGALRGFADLGAELAGAGALPGIFAEVRCCVDRIAALAGDLESLAPRGGAPQVPGDLLTLFGADPRIAGRAARPPADAPAKHCAGCGAVCTDAMEWLIQSLPAGHAPSLHPQDATQDVLSLPLLRLAILNSVAHAAGWHVVVHSGPDWVALVRPPPPEITRIA